MVVSQHRVGARHDDAASLRDGGRWPVCPANGHERRCSMRVRVSPQPAGVNRTRSVAHATANSLRITPGSLPADSGANLGPRPCRDVCPSARAGVLLDGGPVMADAVSLSCGPHFRRAD